MKEKIMALAQDTLANFLDCVKNKYYQIKGRAGRKEYWLFVLANLVISIVLSVVDAIFGIKLFSVIFALAVLVPGIAVAVRRLHDVNRKGWWLLLPTGIVVTGGVLNGMIAYMNNGMGSRFLATLILLAALAASVWLIVLLVKKGDEKENQYGQPQA